MRHLTMEELQAGLVTILESPKDEGRLKMIVRRPQVGQREVIEEGALDLEQGLVGDNWSLRGSSRTVDKSAYEDMQINVMNARVIALVAQDADRWSLAGDQLFVDLDLSTENLPAGTLLEMGSAIIEVTAEPHTGCGKFVSRFGVDATKFINSPRGRELRLRGLNAKVVQPGTIRVGDVVRKTSA